MIKKTVSIAVIGVMMALMMPVNVVKAEVVTPDFEVGAFCCAQSVRVYGDEQPKIDQESGNCVVSVPFDKDKELEKGENEEDSKDTDDVGLYEKWEQLKKTLAAEKERFQSASTLGFSDAERSVLQRDISRMEEELSSLTLQVRAIQTAGTIGGIASIPVVIPSVIAYRIIEGLFVGAKNGLWTLARVLSDTHTKQYHTFLDEEFASALSTMMFYESSEKLNKLLLSYEGECRGANPKPECVAQRLLCSHEKYGQVLFYEASQNVVNDQEAAGDIQKLLQTVQKRDQALLEEAHHAERAIETALAVYDQFFQSYRLHLRLKEMVQNLVKIKDWTGYLRTLVGCFPNKFVGVATTKCN
ncbi:MAG: hypothetical protein P1V18_05660 [Candidatus Gracilibacteria bacterium]|nr:hypothetical protein [Candidatus Gracilibacteria bacterium]